MVARWSPGSSILHEGRSVYKLLNDDLSVSLVDKINATR